MNKYFAALLFSFCVLTSTRAAEVSVAVAANFTVPMQKIATMFEQETGHKLSLAFGSTGRFYAQVKNGAPFDVLFSADDETPAKLEKEGAAVAGSRFTYAIGRLVLWSKQANLVDARGQVLRNANFDKLAIADPKLAPYGAAAIEAMSRLGVIENLRSKLVQGENIAQTYQFVATQNAQLGFIALSQVFAEGRITEGSGWVVPSTLHTPIQQDVVLLQKAAGNVAAIALMQFMKTDKVRALIRTYGYDL